MKPEVIVEKEAVVPDTVLMLHKKWIELKNAGNAMDLMKEFEESQMTIAYLDAKLTEIEEDFKNSLFYNVRKRFRCSECGETGWIAVQITCTKCKKQESWGWIPEEEKK